MPCGCPSVEVVAVASGRLSPALCLRLARLSAAFSPDQRQRKRRVADTAKAERLQQRAARFLVKPERGGERQVDDETGGGAGRNP